jgi:hypothetical protein
MPIAPALFSASGCARQRVLPDPDQTMVALRGLSRKTIGLRDNPRHVAEPRSLVSDCVIVVAALAKELWSARNIAWERVVADPGVRLVLVLIALYFLPSIIAFARRMKNCWSVFFLNLFLGWTIIGWIACLCWSVAGTAEVKSVPAPAIMYDRPPNGIVPVRLDTSAIAREVIEVAKARGYEVRQIAPANISFARGILTVNCSSEGDLLLFKRQLESDARTS